MTDNCPNANTHGSRSLTCVEVLPTPRRVDLATLDDVRLEMAKVYREMKAGDIATQEGTRLAYVLGQIGKLIEANDVQRRVEALEAILARRPRP